MEPDAPIFNVTVKIKTTLVVSLEMHSAVKGTEVSVARPRKAISE